MGQYRQTKYTNVIQAAYYISNSSDTYTLLAYIILIQWILCTQLRMQPCKTPLRSHPVGIKL